MQIKVVTLQGSPETHESTLNAFTKDFWDLVSVVHDGYQRGTVTAYLRKNQVVAAPRDTRPEALTTREAQPTGPHGDTRVRDSKDKKR